MESIFFPRGGNKAGGGIMLNEPGAQIVRQVSLDRYTYYT